MAMRMVDEKARDDITPSELMITKKTKVVTQEWLSERLRVTAPANLVFGMMQGDSMHPTIGPGSLLIIKPCDSVEVDGVYEFTLDGVGASVKRLQRLGSGLVRVIPDNKAYVVASDDTCFKVRGRVVYGMECRAF